MVTFNTSAIRQAIDSGVADGTIIGANVMDEPYVHDTAQNGSTWGPVGTMTKARVDSLCAVVQGYFPTLPAGVEAQHQLFEQSKSYQVCQFIKGTGSPNCNMTSQQVTNYGTALAQYGCALIMWRWDGPYFARAANKTAFQDLANLAATLPFQACRRIP